LVDSEFLPVFVSTPELSPFKRAQNTVRGAPSRFGVSGRAQRAAQTNQEKEPGFSRLVVPRTWVLCNNPRMPLRLSRRRLVFYDPRRETATKLAKALLSVLCLFVVARNATTLLATVRPNQKEQSTFGTEEIPGTPLVKRPTPVPKRVLQILNQDVDVKGCLSDNPLPRGHSLASWFIGSKIHLGGPGESDLVVVPARYECFHSVAGIGIFWVFRPVAGQFELVLKTLGNGLLVLQTRHNGYRNIQTGTLGSAGRFLTTVTFRFDGHKYLKFRERTQKQP
jgi:hypothetical protein